MNDTINRQEAINGKISIQRANGLEIYYDEAVPVEYLKRLPSVQPRKGKWIRTRTMTHDGELYCDQCEQEHPEQKIIWNFCPNCGADMREGDAE